MRFDLVVGLDRVLKGGSENGYKRPQEEVLYAESDTVDIRGRTWNTMSEIGLLLEILRSGGGGGFVIFGGGFGRINTL